MNLIDERSAALRSGDESRAAEITTELSCQCRWAKKAFFKKEVEEYDWEGVRRLRPLQVAQTRVKNVAGVVQPTANRAQTFAEHYRDKQWARDANLPPLPPRPALRPRATVTEGLFQPAELRRAKKEIKRDKESGTDEISSNFLLEILSTPEGFTIVLSIMNSCFSNAELPTMFHVGRIAAIYKKKGDVGLPESYRPISLLQTLYKLFTKLLDLRLRPALEEALSRWQYGLRKNASVDIAITVE